MLFFGGWGDRGAVRFQSLDEFARGISGGDGEFDKGAENNRTFSLLHLLTRSKTRSLSILLRVLLLL